MAGEFCVLLQYWGLGLFYCGAIAVKVKVGHFGLSIFSSLHETNSDPIGF